MRFKTALQLYSVRDFLAEDFAGTLEKVRDMGYEGVEFAGLYDHTAAEVRELTARLALTPISAHVPLDGMLADPDGVLGTYAEIGVKYVAVPYIGEERRPPSGNFEGTLRDIKHVAQAAARHGMLLLYHNHDFEFEKIDGRYVLDIIYDTVDASLLATEVDTCWVNVAGEDPAAYLRKYTGRAPVVHLKDFYLDRSAGAGQMYELIGITSPTDGRKNESFGFRPLGDGVQNFPAILHAAQDAGASWVVVEQDQPTAELDAMACAARSIAYLKTIL